MVIQRIQSLLLLIAAIAMAVFCFIPFASAIAADSAEMVMVSPKEFIVFFILNLTIAILLLISIFMFKNLKRQRTVTLVSILLIVVSAVTGCFIAYGQIPGGKIEIWGGFLLLLVSLVCAVVAYRRIGADQRLLNSAYRLR